mmetsp:Transcript_20374/g.22632  ORF Transcript_20374/g.22632 Transcript_20374/m.22632 type:complete len:150 (+) Transcript_20374:57-506(+)
MAIRRIQKELKDVIRDPPPGCIITNKPKDVYWWTATIAGPEDSPFAGGQFTLDIRIPASYPFKAPKVKFLTPVYHPNVATDGSICVDILKGNWSPALTVSRVILSIVSLLTDPNPGDPLMPVIAQEYVTRRKEYDATARQWTKQYATPK